MTLNEVAPPGFGHTKGDKEKGVKKGGSAAAFDRARKEGRFKGSKSDMFAIMWSQKNKGDKPHYKPGTDKKYKKYQDESYVIEKEDSPYEHASRGSLAGKTRSTGTSEKEHKTSFRRKAHRNSAAMIIRAKRKAERSGKKLSDDSAADLAHKGWASSVKHHKSSMTPEQQKRRQKLADTPYKKLSKDEQDKDKVSAKAIMSVHDKQKVRKESAVLDANTKIKKNEKREKDKKELMKLIQRYRHMKDMENPAKALSSRSRKESFEIDKSAHKTAQKKAKLRNLAKGNTNPNEKAAAEKKAGGPKLMGEGKRWDSYKKAVATVLSKKKEQKKPEKAMDAGARAKRKLQRKVHAYYVSGSEDNVPDDMRD